MEIEGNCPQENNGFQNQPSQEILAIFNEKETNVKEKNGRKEKGRKKKGGKKKGGKRRGGSRTISIIRKKKKGGKGAKRLGGKKKKQKKESDTNSGLTQIQSQSPPQAMQKTMPLNRLQLYMARLRN